MARTLADVARAYRGAPGLGSCRCSPLDVCAAPVSSFIFVAIPYAPSPSPPAPITPRLTRHLPHIRPRQRELHRAYRSSSPSFCTQRARRRGRGGVCTKAGRRSMDAYAARIATERMCGLQTIEDAVMHPLERELGREDERSRRAFKPSRALRE